MRAWWLEWSPFLLGGAVLAVVVAVVLGCSGGLADATNPRGVRMFVMHLTITSRPDARASCPVYEDVYAAGSGH